MNKSETIKKKEKKLNVLNEEMIIEYLKSVAVKIEDLKKIEKHIRIKLYDEYKNIYKEYEDMVNNLNLVYETFRFSRNLGGVINVLEAIYKFEAIFHSDITSLIIKMADNVYYANLHIYVPLSIETFSKVKLDLKKNIAKIKERNPKIKILDYSPEEFEGESFVKNDRLAGNLYIPIYISNKKFGELTFYYVDYRGVRTREK
jgi:hypothetical protein